jgi:hypothetical protein
VALVWRLSATLEPLALETVFVSVFVFVSPELVMDSRLAVAKTVFVFGLVLVSELVSTLVVSKENL